MATLLKPHEHTFFRPEVHSCRQRARQTDNLVSTEHSRRPLQCPSTFMADIGIGVFQILADTFTLEKSIKEILADGLHQTIESLSLTPMNGVQNWHPSFV